VERFTLDSFRKKRFERIGGPPGLNHRYLVIINPISRGGKAKREGNWLLREMGRLGIGHEGFITESAGHAENIVKRFADQVDCVIAVGGDGTVNEVVNGMKASGVEKTLAVFPGGTADDFCHNIGIPRKDRERALEIILDANEREIDLIRCNDRYAVVQIGVGVDAEIAYKTLQYKKIKIPAYFAVGIRVVFKERFRNSPRSLRIESDTSVYDGKFLIAVFGNAPLYGRYVWFMPDARMNDGLLNMSGLRPMSPIPAWSLLMKCMKEDFHSDKILYDQSEHFSIELMEDSFLQIDGEVYRYDEGEKLDLSVERNALRVRVPRGENPRVFAGG
jgi:diacylglycerol kinase (ATP)